MFARALKLAAAFAVGLGTAPASAATFTYNLFDHPDRGIKAHQYGLRVDEYQRFFSFGNGAAAQLIYDSVANTARIIGTMRESLGNGSFGNLWNVDYMVSGVTAGATPGTFVDTTGSGSGSISFGLTSLTLGAKANTSGQYFVFLDDGHRLPDNSTLVGRGWVNNRMPGCCNDFLFIAEKAPGGGVIPLPAAGWMMLTGLAGLGAVSRRHRRG